MFAYLFNIKDWDIQVCHTSHTYEPRTHVAIGIALVFAGSPQDTSKRHIRSDYRSCHQQLAHETYRVAGRDMPIVACAGHR